MAQSVHLVAADGITPVAGGGAATIADGADVAQGAVADAVVAAGAAGTLSAKLRRLTTDLDAANTKLASLVTLAAGGLPAALATGGGLKAMPQGTDGNALLPAAAALSDALANPTTTLIGAAGLVWHSASSQFRRAISAGSVGDGSGGAQVASVVPSALSGGSYDRLRTPATFKTASVTGSGDNALWTPTSTKKFRAMRVGVYVTQDAVLASGADLVIALRDGTAAIGVTFSVFVPAVAGTALGAGWFSGWIDLGNGFLSAAANNVLNVNLSVALTGGACRAIVAGTEE